MGKKFYQYYNGTNISSQKNRQVASTKFMKKQKLYLHTIMEEDKEEKPDKKNCKRDINA